MDDGQDTNRLPRPEEYSRELQDVLTRAYHDITLVRRRIELAESGKAHPSLTAYGLFGLCDKVTAVLKEADAIQAQG